MRVSCVCCTYGRFSLLRRSIAFWLNQDYEDKELVIFNTADVALTLSGSLADSRIRVINNPRDNTTGTPYSSLGAIRQDSLTHVGGEIYVCWDDDDMFLPWHLSQGVYQLKRCGRGAWMPAQSYYSKDGGRVYWLARNHFEASVLVRTEHLRRYGFDLSGSGTEHRPWRIGMVRDGQLSEYDEVTPFESYAYIWGEPGHKISSRGKDNFERHKEESNDFGVGMELTAKDQETIEIFYNNVYECYPDARLGERLNEFLKVHRIAMD